MTVTVLLKSIPRSVTIDLEENETVYDALSKCVPSPDEACLKVVAGRAVGDTEILKDGDVLEIYPSIIGG